MQNLNGSEVLAGILKRVESLQTLPVEKTAEQPPGIDPTKLAEQIKLAARSLGDGQSDNPATHTPTNQGLEHGPEKNTDPVSEAASGPGLSSNIKAAVFAGMTYIDEKIASAQGAAKKWLAYGGPLAGLGVGGAGGYYAGRKVGDKIDRKNNKAYYHAGAYDVARQLAAQIQARGVSK
ncbi:MAG: hypothetical protein Q8M92_01750 [Candidatus Subteraquimicrobiales bacterium]|nr:hypothetical protein [Candidatus Subteraquimicrobiales bacterium]